MLKIFGGPKHQKREFGYQPRYYNSEKEEMERRIKRAELKEKIDADLTKSRLSSEFKTMRERGNTQKHKNIMHSSTLRLLIIFMVLCGIAYFVLNQFLPSFMAYLFDEPQ
ncbi:MAG: hypothetical protein GY810_04200 [Aureispira sp.]|nr:hypothetical protein [Aureispira sp.]